LEQLTAEQRASIELAYYLGHSCSEIATIMGCGVPAAKARIFQARRRLRASLPMLAGDSTRTFRTSRGLSAAFALAIGLASLIFFTWPSGDAPPAYRTVTEAAPQIEGTVIHAVFAPGLDPREREEILQSASVRIVGGPTLAGVYSLAPRAGTDVAAVRASLQLLRRDSRVRFAVATIEVADE
jgi:hypothetical protein